MWALGCVLQEMCTLERAFEGTVSYKALINTVSIELI